MLFRNPRALPALLLCVGLALAGMRAWELRELPEWTDAEIDHSVELNYALDLARGRASAMDPIPVLPEDESRRRKAVIREEVIASTRGAREKALAEFRQGILVALTGAILCIVVIALQRRGTLKSG